jgi:hypothetical protein
MQDGGEGVSFREIVRFIVRLIMTPVVIVAFGFFWLMFVSFLGSAFAFISFLENEPFDWGDHMEECNEFFMEPLNSMWRQSA